MDKEQARATGAATMGTVRRMLARRAAELIRSDPEDAAVAVEMGLIDRRWLEDPGEHPIATAAPTEILERFLERAVDRRPSRLSALGLNAVQLLASRHPDGSGQPEPVTVVFTDLEGFTAYTDSHGDDAALALVTEHQHLARPVVRQWGGRVVKTLGDGLLCTFPVPADGICAALALLVTAPAPLRLRAGVHVGEALVSRSDVLGHVVNVAARVTDTAKGGQVVATTEAVTAAGALPGVLIGRPRSRRLKGVEERVGISRVSLAPGARPPSAVPPPALRMQAGDGASRPGRHRTDPAHSAG